jgi:hypothetical protein
MTPAPQKEIPEQCYNCLMESEYIRKWCEDKFGCTEVMGILQHKRKGHNLIEEYTSASSDVLDELYSRLINSRETVGRYDVVTITDIECIFAELRQQTKCEEVPKNLEQVKAKPSKEREQG